MRASDRPKPKYEPLKAWHHFRILLKDKENTAEVFKIFDALPSKDFMRRVRALTLSAQGEDLRARERSLPAILDDHEALRRLPKGSVAHAYCDFMEREGLSAAGLVEESEKSGRPIYDDLVQWYGFRLRDTHDLMHVLTGYGRDALGEQCVLLFTHGQNPSHGHLLLGYAGAWHMKGLVKSSAPVLKAVRQAHQTGRACPSLVGMSITDLLAMDLGEARRKLGIPEPDRYHECHRVWSSEGIDPYDLLAPRQPQTLAA
ncbi:MAG: hypothetical protein APF82_08140 [Sphingomonadales bacterium BRH_c42]|nr:MAG: hypothetical protein APF82_08140 [Sphingomonadales bacterium BRH_c42]